MKSVHSETATSSGAERAAQAIVELINSRPRSPRSDEIAAIIRRIAIPEAVASCSQGNDLDREYGPTTRQLP